MSIFSFLSFVFSSLLFFSFIRAEKNQESAVISLNDVNFDEYLASGETWFINFYKEDCHHCHRLEPIWEEFAQELKQTQPDIKVGKVDLEKSPNLRNRFFIWVVPVLKLFKGNARYDYNQPKDKQNFYQYLEENYQNAQKFHHVRGKEEKCTYLTPDSLKEKLDLGESWMVFFYAPWCRHSKDLFPLWEDFARYVDHANKSYQVGIFDCHKYADFCKMNGITSFPIQRFLKKSGDTRKWTHYRGGKFAEFWIDFADQVEEGKMDEKMERPEGELKFILHKKDEL